MLVLLYSSMEKKEGSLEIKKDMPEDEIIEDNIKYKIF